MIHDTWEKVKTNPELLETYLVREKVIDSIRDFFKSNNFNEVHTPILVPTPSIEPNLEAFETSLNTSSGIHKKAFLIMSPEYSHKKLLAAGLKNIFEITKAFRNFEDVSSTHNPEFTILEWYRVNADYFNIMDDFENMFIKILKATGRISKSFQAEYLGNKYNLQQPWKRITVADAFENYAKVNIDTLLNERELLKLGKEKGYQVSSNTNWEEMFYQIFMNEVEPELKAMNNPVFIYDYPLSQASLARKKESDPRFAERFEIYFAGLELGNCFSELTDPIEQEKRFKSDYQERIRLNKNPYPIDNNLIKALKSGIPPVSGIAVGVDRIVMIAADTDSIDKTMFFPAKELFDLG